MVVWREVESVDLEWSSYKKKIHPHFNDASPFYLFYTILVTDIMLRKHYLEEGKPRFSKNDRDTHPSLSSNITTIDNQNWKPLTHSLFTLHLQEQ